MRTLVLSPSRSVVTERVDAALDRGQRVLYVSSGGAKSRKGAPGCAFALIYNPSKPAAAGADLTTSASFDDSLLRTNVQKAVRRGDPASARLSVLQYFAQQKTASELKTLMDRLPVIAAEDADWVPLLPACMFLSLGATSLGAGFLKASAYVVADCAAALAAAPRNVTAKAAPLAWSEGVSAPASRSASSSSSLSSSSSAASAFTAAQSTSSSAAAASSSSSFSSPPASSSAGLAAALLLNAADELLASGSCQDARWVRSLSAAVPAAPPLLSAVPASWPALKHCILTPGSRLWFAADFHNKARSQALLVLLSQSLGAPKLTIAAMESLMKRQSYLNTRDGACVHLFNSVVALEAEEHSFTFAAFDAHWEAASRTLWEPLSKKRKTQTDTGMQTQLKFSRTEPPPPVQPSQSLAGAPSQSLAGAPLPS